jgi:hypothetical protein
MGGSSELVLSYFSNLEVDSVMQYHYLPNKASRNEKEAEQK